MRLIDVENAVKTIADKTIRLQKTAVYEYQIGRCRGMLEACEIIINLPAIEVPIWIPVSEQYPESDTRVLVYRPTMAIKYMQSYYHKNAGFCDGALDIYGNEVITHWMPLPQPPKDGENK